MKVICDHAKTCGYAEGCEHGEKHGARIDALRAELAAAKAEIERLRVLVETAFVDALIFVAGWDADLAAEKWNDSDAKRALEKGKGSACDER